MLGVALHPPWSVYTQWYLTMLAQNHWPKNGVENKIKKKLEKKIKWGT